MTSSKIQLPSKEELTRRLNELIPAEEIERDRAFYLHGLMWFTAQHMGEARRRKPPDVPRDDDGGQRKRPGQADRYHKCHRLHRRRE